MNIGTPLLKGQLGAWLGPTSMYRAPSLKKVKPAGAQRRRQVCQLLSTAMDERLVDAPLPARAAPVLGERRSVEYSHRPYT